MSHADEFSLQEREALALWPADAPPAGFAERVLIHAGHAPALRTSPFRVGAARALPWRGFAAAAAAVLLVGGLWSARGSLERGLAVPPSFVPETDRAFLPMNPDGGVRPETAEAAPRLDLPAPGAKAS